MQQYQQEHQQRAARIEELLQEVSMFKDAQARSITEELVQLLLDLYGEGLARMLKLTQRASTTGEALVERFTQDELLASLLLLHGLHPLDIETRVHQALEKVRTTPTARNSTVELLEMEEGRIRVRLNGTHGCHSCHASSTSFSALVEQALHEAAPELEEILIEQDNQEPGTRIPVTFVPTRRQRDKTR
jgi:Fe-S cluster biogenesis protein NfuA